MLFGRCDSLKDFEIILCYPGGSVEFTRVLVNRKAGRSESETKM